MADSGPQLVIPTGMYCRRCRYPLRGVSGKRMALVTVLMYLLFGTIAPGAEAPESLGSEIQAAMGLPFGTNDPLDPLRKLVEMGFLVNGERWDRKPSWPDDVTREFNRFVDLVSAGPPKDWLRRHFLESSSVKSDTSYYVNGDGPIMGVDGGNWLPGVKVPDLFFGQLLGVLSGEMDHPTHVPQASRVRVARTLLLVTAQLPSLPLPNEFADADKLAVKAQLPKSRAAVVAKIVTETDDRYIKQLLFNFSDYGQANDPRPWQAAQVIINRAGAAEQPEIDMAVAKLDQAWESIDPNFVELRWKTMNLVWRLLNWAHDRQDQATIAAVEGLLRRWGGKSDEKYVRRWVDEALTVRAGAPMMFPTDAPPPKPAPDPWLSRVVALAGGEFLRRQSAPAEEKKGKGTGSQEEALDALLLGFYVTPDQIVAPEAEKDAPEVDDYSKWPVAKRLDWVRANAAFVLITGLSKAALEEEAAPLAFSKPSLRADEQIAVAYTDGKSEFLPIEKVKTLVEQSTGKSLEQWLPKGPPPAK